jgi:PilZ domain
MRSQAARRSDRVSVTVPIEVIGRDINGHQFEQQTRTLVISRYGASIALACKLAPRQEFVIRRQGIEKKAKVRVVKQVGGQSGEYVYGVMLLDPSVNLWAIEFPPLAESEKAVARTLLECCCCQTHEVAYFNEIEFKAFVTDQGIARYCGNCAASTTWRQALHESFSRPELPSASRSRTQDRRKEVRSKVNLTACIRQPGFDEEVVICENISHGGLSFRSGNCHPKGSRIQVAVPYSPRAANIFVPAWVIYFQELTRGDVFRHGVAYRIRNGTRE